MVDIASKRRRHHKNAIRLAKQRAVDRKIKGIKGVNSLVGTNLKSTLL